MACPTSTNRRRRSHDLSDADGQSGPQCAAIRAFVRATVLGTCTAAIAVALTGINPASTASADPSASAWHQLRVCESGNNYATNTGNGHYGAYQFDLSTWRSVGGSGYPYQASASEQDARALILYRMRGWQPWQCARIVGLREDADARSGRISDIHVPGGSVSSGSHVWPGTYYRFGDHSSGLRQWQLRMKARGAPLTGSGQFGQKTLAVVKRIQRLNHLPGSGVLGPKTWALAWNGRYSNATTKPAPRPKPKPKPSAAPRSPGHYYSFGDRGAPIRLWQLRMKARGAPLTGSGQFGKNTLAVVKRIQRLNHLPATGILGPNTWRLAWKGRY
jgi:peptidoglycan hydrolase-like protein with peptidoglycan-binding domain